jgi:hypothetical protein
MANPDRGSSSIGSLGISIPVGLLFLVICIGIFQFKANIPAFNIFIWLGLPIIGFILVFVINLVSQFTGCNSIDAGKAALGSIPSVFTILIALVISSVSVCRIPVASVFAPLIVGDTYDITQYKTPYNTNSLKNSRSKECCIPKITIESVESNYPIMMGISYGFYLMFAIFFGSVIGNNIATVC